MGGIRIDGFSETALAPLNVGLTSPVVGYGLGIEDGQSRNVEIDLVRVKVGAW